MRLCLANLCLCIVKYIIFFILKRSFPQVKWLYLLLINLFSSILPNYNDVSLREIMDSNHALLPQQYCAIPMSHNAPPFLYKIRPNWTGKDDVAFYREFYSTIKQLHSWNNKFCRSFPTYILYFAWSGSKSDQLHRTMTGTFRPPW